MFNIFFILIIVIILFDHVVGLVLDHLNSLMWSETVPAQLKGIVEDEKYKQSQNYYRQNTRFGNISSSIYLALILAVLFSEGFAFIDDLARSVSENDIIITLLFFGILGVVSSIFSIPFSLYGTFVIEQKFGFNKTSRKTFFTDILKGWMLAVLIGGPLIALITWIYYKTGDMFWIYVWMVISGFSVFMNMFYSELIVPLFNKQKPLEEGELRTAIEAMSENAGFKLANIFTIDGSKRSTKANAYFSGLGRKKRIVLYDTLSDDLSNDEIVAVLAHEIGHYKKKHTLLMLISGILQTGLMLYLFSILASNESLSLALGSETPSFHLSLLAFGLLYSPVSTIIGLLMNYLSRKYEYSADSFAKGIYSGEKLASSLKKLSVKNLSNMLPHPVYVFFSYSHPPLLERLKALG